MLFTLSQADGRIINKITDKDDVNDSAAKDFMQDFEIKTREFCSTVGMKWKIYGLRHAEYPIVIHNAMFEKGPNNPHILDAGYNVWFDYYLAKYCHARVASNDIEYTPAFQKAMRGFEIAGLDVYPVVALAQNIDLPDSIFDYVFCISVLEHVPFNDRPKCVENFIRLIKPGGKIIISVDTGTVYQQELGTQAYKPEQVYPQLIEPFLSQVEIDKYDFSWGNKREYIRVKNLGALSPAIFTLIKRG